MTLPFTMRSSLLALAAGLMLAGPAAAAPGDLRDFRLPTPGGAPATPRPPGPVAPDVPESRIPRAVVTATPTPTPTPAQPPTPSPTPTRSAAPRAVASPAPAARVTSTAVPRDSASPVPAPASPEPAADVAPIQADLPTSAPPPAAALPPVATAPVAEGDEPFPWPWLIAGALVLAAAGGAAWLASRRRRAPRALAVPTIEKPRLPPEPARVTPDPIPDATPPLAPTAVGEPLQLTLEPLRLSLTLFNAALTYRLEVANHGPHPLQDLRIGADMISAHASLTREEQLAGPGSGALTLHRLDRLEPGESRIVEGEFRLPFPQIVPIRQGNAAMLLPLARFRAQADGTAPVLRTFAVGQPGPSGLQLFRLDQGPRVYPKLTQRAFA